MGASDRPERPKGTRGDKKKGEAFARRLEAGAPWPLQALCTQCGEEHTARTFSTRRRDYEGPLFRYGTCEACLTREKEEDEARRRAVEKQPEEEVPRLADLDKVREAITQQEDVFDPFEGRTDLHD